MTPESLRGQNQDIQERKEQQQRAVEEFVQDVLCWQREPSRPLLTRAQRELFDQIHTQRDVLLEHLLKIKDQVIHRDTNQDWSAFLSILGCTDTEAEVFSGVETLKNALQTALKKLT